MLPINLWGNLIPSWRFIRNKFPQGRWVGSPGIIKRKINDSYNLLTGLFLLPRTHQNPQYVKGFLHDFKTVRLEIYNYIRSQSHWRLFNLLSERSVIANVLTAKTHNL